MIEEYQSIEEILQKCADLRGVSNLINRTHEEFAHFVMSVLYGNITSMHYSKDLWNKYDIDEHDPSYSLALCFLCYCINKYDPTTIKLNHIKRLQESIDIDTDRLNKLQQELTND